jgi:hypothetical protein
MSGNLNNDQLNRLWTHAIHEDDVFNHRLNFFLVFESVLLGVVGVLFGVLYNKSLPTKPLLASIIVLGLLLTFFWGYLQARQQDDYKVVAARLREADPEYREYRTTIAQLEQRKWPIPAMSLLTYGVPFVVVLMWICILVVILIS